ncbi:169_t:CDS:2 [Dentiscutata erythropus]|uniref:169_t:CDS:1 n=1 Tax=Dentiscutata erythropus TaxID=1348616 RepID=A0A9N8ZTX4_9GLOM|nr:169_t:CDS:2 [Dentiscutata erythropus]
MSDKGYYPPPPQQPQGYYPPPPAQQSGYYQPTPPPQVVVQQQTPPEKKDNSLCLGCALGACLCCCFEECC